MAFEETGPELAVHVVDAQRGHVHRSEIGEAGEYDLEGLFIRLGHAIDSIGAKRVVLDTIEALFSRFPNQGVLRSEIRRLFRWLKDKGVTTVITATSALPPTHFSGRRR